VSESRRSSDLGARVRTLRLKLFGEHGAKEIARLLGLPTSVWLNYEATGAIPGPGLGRKDLGQSDLVAEWPWSDVSKPSLAIFGVRLGRSGTWRARLRRGCATRRRPFPQLMSHGAASRWSAVRFMSTSIRRAARSAIQEAGRLPPAVSGQRAGAISIRRLHRSPQEPARRPNVDDRP
jgi:hypothetical protein